MDPGVVQISAHYLQHRSPEEKRKGKVKDSRKIAQLYTAARRPRAQARGTSFSDASTAAWYVNTYTRRQYFLRVPSLVLPPRRGIVAEVRLKPGAQLDLLLLGQVDVREDQGVRRGTLQHAAHLVVLRAMARADEPLRAGIPRCQATEVRALGFQRKV